MKAVITQYKNRIVSAVFDDNKIESINFAPEDTSLVGKIFVGKVLNVVKNLEACFVEYQKGCNCFLHQRECLGRKLPKQGDFVLITIIREGIKTKEPAASMKISVKSQDVILTLSDEFRLGISQKITLKKERERLKGIVDNIYSSVELNGMDINAGLDIMLRTSCQGMEENKLTLELNTLVEEIRDLLHKGKTRTCYSLVRDNQQERFLEIIKEINKYSNEGFEGVVTDVKEVYELLKPSMAIKFYEDSLPLNKLYSVNERIEELLGAKVYLKCGGYLVIQQTEALNVIDVNSGKYIKDTSNSQAIETINIQAALESARQIRLRNLSGIIIIDFINTDKEGERKLIEILNDEFKKDRMHPTVVDVTKLGLFEITRKKLEKSLGEQL